MVLNQGSLDTVYLTSVLPEFETWLSIHRDVASSTFKHHHYTILKILHHLNHFNKNTVENYLFEAKSQKEPGTIENYVFTLRVFCKFLQSMGILKENFAADIPLPKRNHNVPVILTVAEI
ncbi:MAG: hypothetical protein ACD_24C00247G0001, partial [uncultured bacterium]